MSKKSLDESAIINELKGSSLFFAKQEESPTVHAAQKDPPRAALTLPASPEAKTVKDSTSPPHFGPHEHETPVDSKESERKLDSAHASTLASYPEGLVESIRKIVKSVGKEVSFVRLTPEEKNQLVDLVYTYKRQGVKTSENEINRIAVNLVLADYEANGEASILARVIEALLA
jgi:hypothetical protein